jgi:hypothetical protein
LVWDRSQCLFVLASDQIAPVVECYSIGLSPSLWLTLTLGICRVLLRLDAGSFSYSSRWTDH